MLILKTEHQREIVTMRERPKETGWVVCISHPPPAFKYKYNCLDWELKIQKAAFFSASSKGIEDLAQGRTVRR